MSGGQDRNQPIFTPRDRNDAAGDTMPRPVTKAERKLLDYFRDELKWGEAVVAVKDGKPVMVKQERRDIKLTD